MVIVIVIALAKALDEDVVDVRGVRVVPAGKHTERMCEEGGRVFCHYYYQPCVIKHGLRGLYKKKKKNTFVIRTYPLETQCVPSLRTPTHLRTEQYRCIYTREHTC